MKILHLNFSSKGGAGIGVARLHDSLKKRNIKSYVLHYDEFINDGFLKKSNNGDSINITRKGSMLSDMIIANIASL